MGNIIINTLQCHTTAQINSLGGEVVLNSDGTVSVFLPDVFNNLAPVILNETCCHALTGGGYDFYPETQECRWSPPTSSTCDFIHDVKLVINPQGDDGTLFYVNEGDNCGLNIDFNFLMKVRCETIADIITKIGLGTSPCATSLSIFENLNASVVIDIVTSANTLQTVFETPLFPFGNPALTGTTGTTIGDGNLYAYLTSQDNSGFYVCGDSSGECIPISLNITGATQTNSSPCNAVVNNLLTELFNESGLSGSSSNNVLFAQALNSNALASNWLNYNTIISDPSILDLITNQKIKLSVKINSSCSDFCLLMDSINLNKTCTHVEKTNIFVTQSPGFTLERVIDNKKSWLSGTGLTSSRLFSMTNVLENNPIRQTDYNTDDDRLILNSKEIDLDMNLAGGIETDVWCHLLANECLLTGITNCDPCSVICGTYSFMDGACYQFNDSDEYDFMDGESNSTLNHSNCCGDDRIDFSSLMTEPLSAITTLEAFEYFMTSELTDVKNRQTISGYPTLRALYDRYMNSTLYCSGNSSMFTYLSMEQFAKMVGNYWVDVIEQVVPATSIWGSVVIYSNTIFDQQKFKYKAYSSLFCGNPLQGTSLPGPINGNQGNSVVVNVITTPINLPTLSGLTLTSQVTTTCDVMYVAQMNSSSEFIGTVTVIS